MSAAAAPARARRSDRRTVFPCRLRATHEVVCNTGVLHRHEVRYLGDAAVGQEPRKQHVGVGQIKLPVYRVVELRRDLEAAAAIGVEESSKHRG